jgi:hypothetical protein
MASARTSSDIVGVLCPQCAGDMDRYADGRSVTSQPRFCEGSQFVHLWHPDPAHPWNRPQEVGTLTTRNGTRKRVVVTAPRDHHRRRDPKRGVRLVWPPRLETRSDWCKELGPQGVPDPGDDRYESWFRDDEPVVWFTAVAPTPGETVAGEEVCHETLLTDAGHSEPMRARRHPAR